MKSERLYLRPIMEADLAELAPFFNEPSNVKFYIPTLWRRYTHEQVRSLLADWHDQSAYFVYAICAAADDSVVGLANLDGVNYINGNTEIGIAITAVDRQGQGLAEEALRLLIGYCFAEMRLHRVWARIMAGNEPSLRLFRKLGFTEEGRLREQVRREGGYMDMIFMGLLENEWPD